MQVYNAVLVIAACLSALVHAVPTLSREYPTDTDTRSQVTIKHYLDKHEALQSHPIELDSVDEFEDEDEDDEVWAATEIDEALRRQQNRDRLQSYPLDFDSEDADEYGREFNEDTAKDFQTPGERKGSPKTVTEIKPLPMPIGSRRINVVAYADDDAYSDSSSSSLTPLDYALINAGASGRLEEFISLFDLSDDEDDEDSAPHTRIAARQHRDKVLFKAYCAAIRNGQVSVIEWMETNALDFKSIRISVEKRIQIWRSAAHSCDLELYRRMTRLFPDQSGQCFPDAYLTAAKHGCTAILTAMMPNVVDAWTATGGVSGAAEGGHGHALELAWRRVSSLMDVMPGVAQLALERGLAGAIKGQQTHVLGLIAHLYGRDMLAREPTMEERDRLVRDGINNAKTHSFLKDLPTIIKRNWA